MAEIYIHGGPESGDGIFYVHTQESGADNGLRVIHDDEKRVIGAIGIDSSVVLPELPSQEVIEEGKEI